ncbi:DUF262 domain-containing HNH endonuclease family protein [uncultured Chryseobacterium sp.]|uniref:DUF262 domain-containing protein n=1 Tax=uncultured Chryseobacterium sp. TaxID=259322 RepID=UPI0025FD9BF0|nr:DUF262 domain-containing HNH endonuclease family protein [uncultured Chryseobacterium sp.]
MQIVPKDFTLHALLNNPNEQYQIPSYQRRYAWKYNQQAALFKDIDMLMPNDGHLFGMLILHTGLYHGGTNTVHVVDGQQRLTTISILLFALRNKFKELGEDFTVSQISQLLFCGNFQEEKTPKIILGELDNDDYLWLLKSNIDKIKNKRISEAFQTFQNFINEGYNEKGKEWLNGYLQKFIYTAKIIRLDVQQAQDAYKLFETINNRGLKLSSTDILKNFILGHAAKISEQKLEKTKILWADLITALDGIPTDDFFRQYVTSIYTRKITINKLIEDFKKHYFKNVKEVDKLGEYRYSNGAESSEQVFDEEEEDIENILDTEHNEEVIEESKRVDLEVYLKRIVDAANCYSKIWNQKFSDKKLNEKIKDLIDVKSFPSYIYLMHYLQTDSDKKEKYKVLDMITTIMLRRHICAKRTSENDDIFAKLLRIDFDISDYVKEVKNQLLTDCPEDDEFLIRFPEHEFKQRVLDRARYMLCQIEYFKTGNTGEFSINSPEDVHIEHIIPQKINTARSKEEFGDWEKYLGDKAKIHHKQKVHRIGNLTLLSSSLNITASNNPFTRKKKSYRESNIFITKSLANQSDFTFYHLDKRGNEMAEIAKQIWKI